jgi:hypothetical protein
MSLTSTSSFDSDDDFVVDNINILTEDEMLFAGLEALGWEVRRLKIFKRNTNIDRFRGMFGINPDVCAQLWEDLQTTDIVEAWIHPDDRDLLTLFMALHFLKRYPTEIERESIWKPININVMRENVWLYIQKIQALKTAMLPGWPGDNFGDDKWVMSVDGVHFVTEEPTHPNFPKDKGYFSFKHNSAGFVYEIGLSLYESKLIWFNGPFPAGMNDIQIFGEQGLKNKLQSTGKKIIADGGYRGYPKIASTPNSQDTEEVSKFKVRARQRHEKYNGMIKEFECLDSRFHHSRERLVACFEAVVVLVEYKMEMGNPLFDI